MFKYTPAELKKQALGFVFNVDAFFATILPTGWTSKQLVYAKDNIILETRLMSEVLAKMSLLGLRKKAGVKDTLKKFVREYGTGLSNEGKSKKLPHGQNMLRNRVEMALIAEHVEDVERKYQGRHFIWLPSDAKEPRHSHMLRYGKVYEVGTKLLPSDDNFPGKAPGCKCGYQWVDKPVSKYDVAAEEDVSLRRVPKVKSKK